MIRTVLLILTFATEAVGASTPRPSPADLLRGFYTEPPRLLVVMDEDGKHGWQAMLEDSVYPQIVDLSFAGAGEVDRESLASSAVMLAGTTTSSNPWFSELADGLPLTVAESRFTFLGETYDQPDDAVFFLHPNPLRPDRALYVVLANSKSSVEQVISRLPANEHYMAFCDGELVRFGRFTGTDWALDAQTDRRIRRVRSTPELELFVQDGMTDGTALDALVSAKQDVRERVRGFLGTSELSRLRLFVYPRIADKGLFTRDTRIAHSDPMRGKTHVALEPGFEGDAWDTETVTYLRQALGKPRTRALEVGLGVLLSQSWRKQGWRYWAARYHLADMVLPLEELLASDLLDPHPYITAYDKATETYPLRTSPLLHEPLAAALVDWLIETWGRETFLERYAEWQPSGPRLEAVEKRWHEHLARLADEHAAAIARHRESFPRTTGLQLGANHTFEGFSVESGYLSAGSDAALAHLRSLGANAVAVVPYTYFCRRDGRASPLPFMRGAGKENDESVVHAGLEAKRSGMSVLLKPQLQCTWPGHVKMASTRDWEDFLGYYERWLRHYAILAEMYGFEVLSLGVEMVEATTNNEERWREMVSRIRKIYSGELIYSANWGREFAQLGFWDAFDYLGVDCYYPLSEKDDASDAEHAAGARSVVERIAAVQQRFAKPVLFTELGFPSATATWKEPWKEPDGRRDTRGIDLGHQARAFEAMFQALAGRSWVRGLYWWKWSSQPSGRPDPSFVINGKPAEAVMARWFEKLAQPPTP